MESEIEHIDSELFDKKRFQKQLDMIIEQSDLAKDKIDYTSAHNDSVIRSIEIVENFLRKKHRLCYGGQAINAHLPAKYKFYDPDTSVPDYDFFTPQQNNDIDTIIKDLKKAGFMEISAREGMHEGTIKIYVNYVPVADITAIDPKLYKILSKREFKTDGISYLDSNTLRMLMYLELSRPRGEVTRWPKVFERLSLFNEFIPVKLCRISNEELKREINQNQLQFVINFVITNKRIFAGADLLDFYNTSLRKKKINNKWIITRNKPIIFFSQEPDSDAAIISSEFSFLNDKKITIKSYSSKGVELIPSMKIICQGKKQLIFIIQQVACHSYFNIPITNNKNIRIASMDTLITLYFSLGFVDSKYFDMGSIECIANKLVDISSKARNNPNNFPFPFISIECDGHQTSLPSLIRERVKRITQKKQHPTNLPTELYNRIKTVKNKKNKNKNNKTTELN